MSQPPDQINQQREVFNEHGELFGSDSVPKNIHYLKALPKTAPDSGSSPKSERPLVIRDFGGTPEEIRAANIKSNPSGTITAVDTTPKRVALIGNFSAVRSARILHQHKIKFWSATGAIQEIIGPPIPDPSSNDASQMYKDFLLFSYLPPQMMPTKERFIDLVTPSKLPDILVSTPTPPAEDPVAHISLPDPLPYAESIGFFCKALGE